MTELIITEKPSASLRIANALADTKPEKKTLNRVSYYELKHKGKEIIVACAVGHLYGLAEKEKNGWKYPTFDVEWKEAYNIKKASAYTKKYITVIQSLAKKADSFVVACDYDIEGEVIGLNVVRFACKQKDANRMKFSTLTKEELIKSYEKKSKHLDWGQAKAGETRHYLDYHWGINLSRALTLAIKNSTGRFKVLSSGRVQGPALKILAEREKGIQRFKPVPYWQLFLEGESKKQIINAKHKKDRFLKEDEAIKILEKVKGEKAVIGKVDRKTSLQNPPNPFDLTSLQLEAYKTLGILPKDILTITQDLYSNGFISYPRTSSNMLPESIGYKRILTLLSKQAKYKQLCNKLLRGKLEPNNGKKKDPAHPAIYPTGEVPKLEGRKAKLYDLIVRRTLATFAESAKRETMTVTITIEKEDFLASGSRTIERGWHVYYEPYVMLKEEELPDVKEKDEVKVKKLWHEKKETQPPKRYTPASIIKELEKKNLGTKATRANIIEALYDRKYIRDKSIIVTKLGMATVEALKKYSPEILDENLTEHFEIDMENIRTGKKEPEEVLKESKKVLIKILEHFKQNELQIGKDLAQANRETEDKENFIGKCPNCEGNLRIRYSPKNKSYFVACDKFPECKTTFSLPRYAKPVTSEKRCDRCGFPMVKMIRKGKRPYDYCINQECPAKQEWREKNGYSKP